jgi:hypothetical protein
LSSSFVQEITDELHYTFSYVVGNVEKSPVNAYAVCSSDDFLQIENLDGAHNLLLYLDESMAQCLDQYSHLKQKNPRLHATFCFPRKFKAPWKKALNSLPYIHNFIKGRKNHEHVKLLDTLSVHKERRSNSIFAAFAATHSELLMNFTGELSGTTCRVALDTMASHSFISPELVKTLGRKRLSKTTAMTVELGNGSPVTTQGCFKSKLILQNFRTNCVLNVLELAPDFDVILGQDWLKEHRVVLDFDNRIAILKRGKRIHTLRHEPLVPLSEQLRPSDTSVSLKHTGLLSAMQLKRMVRKGAKLLLISVKAASSADQSHQTTGLDHPDIQLIVEEFAECFKEIPPGLPPDRPGVVHQIHMTPDAKPVSRPTYRLSPAEKREVERQLKEQLSQDWIEPSVSPWGSPILFAQKKGGTLRMCVDYRALNKYTVKNRYPLPRADDLFDSLHGAKYFSSLDLASGYHQIRIAEEDRPKTAFRTPFGHFQYKVLSFGLTNAPATFQAAMDAMLGPLIGKGVLVYLDDILIYSETWEEHLYLLRQVLQRIRNNKYYCRLWKCNFGQTSIEYLGHIVSNGEIRMDPAKLEAVSTWPTPRMVPQVRQFLGFTNYFRKFIQGYSLLVKDLTGLTAKSSEWEWNENHQFAFEHLIHLLTENPVLKLPDFSKPFEVVSDASMYGAGAVLLQDGHPIAFESKKFTSAERNYTTTEQEMLAAHFALHKWRCYLEGTPFTLITDHCPNTFFKTQQNLSRRQARWSEFFQRFDFEWQYQPGRTNLADPLSRLPTLSMADTETGAPNLKFACLRGSALFEALAPARDLWTDPTPLLGKRKICSAKVNPAVSREAFFAALTLVHHDSTLITRLTSFEKEIAHSYRLDPWFTDKKNHKVMFFRNELWWYKDRPTAVVVPDVLELKMRILHEAHDAPYSGHCSRSKTLKAIQPYFWWPKIAVEVGDQLHSQV